MAALVTSAALAFGGCGVVTSGPPTAPVTFSTTTTTPTSTIPTPTAKAYIGPDGIAIETGPFLGAATTTQLGRLVKRIQCESLAQLAYTAYAHLLVYVNGHSRALPGGIGMVDAITQPTQRGLVFTAHTCTYWLHTRAADGLIAVRVPGAAQVHAGGLLPDLEPAAQRRSCRRRPRTRSPRWWTVSAGAATRGRSR